MSVWVIGVVGGALIGAFSYGFLVIQMVRENQRAAQIIMEKVETIRLYSWDQVLEPGFIPTVFTEVYDPQAPTGHQGVVYNGTVAIESVPYSASYKDNLRQMTITLTWTGVNNFTRTRRIATAVARDGLQNYVF